MTQDYFSGLVLSVLTPCAHRKQSDLMRQPDQVVRRKQHVRHQAVSFYATLSPTD